MMSHRKNNRQFGFCGSLLGICLTVQLQWPHTDGLRHGWLKKAACDSLTRLATIATGE